MNKFQSCVFLGPLTTVTTDRTGAYLEDLGVHDKIASDLLVTLADMTSL